MDNTVHFQKYNSGRSIASPWPDSPYFINLQDQKRRSSTQKAKDKKRNLEIRQAQQSILQLLIDARGKSVNVETIAARIGRSRNTTVAFLITQADDLWMCANGDVSRWWTSLRILPDRLFY